MGTTNAERRRNSEYYANIDLGQFSDRERQLHLKTGEYGLTFFGAARLSTKPEYLRFGIVKKILSNVNIANPKINRMYKSWSENSPAENIEIGIGKGNLSTTSVESLVTERDPAIIVISSLEKIRLKNYSEISIEKTLNPKSEDRLTLIYQTYEHLLSSIHNT